RRLNGGPDPLSTSQIPLFVLNLVPIQQRAVFLLGSPYPVVFALAPQLLLHLGHLRFTHRKGAIAILPAKGTAP
ncbi:MAG: hypothetical protein ACLQM8_17010, partial [Limisphaerales bacterium]